MFFPKPFLPKGSASIGRSKGHDLDEFLLAEAAGAESGMLAGPPFESPHPSLSNVHPSPKLNDHLSLTSGWGDWASPPPPQVS